MSPSAKIAGSGRSRISRVVHSKVTWALGALGSVLLAVGLVLFEPWALWVDKTVVEALPVAPGTSVVAPAVVAPAVVEPAAAMTPEAPAAAANEPVTEYRGKFISHEHETTGTVRILLLADGSRVLRLENLDTSNGPDLKVLLSDAAVKPGRAGWHVFDDDAHRSLGGLKGNKGSQNYVIPADVDLGEFRSVSIWCDRFNVSFGATELTRVAP